MQGNYNSPTDGVGSSQDQNRTQFDIFDHAYTLPITAQPQHLNKNPSHPTGCAQGGSRNSYLNTNFQSNHGGTNGPNIQPGLKIIHPSDQNTKVNSSNSVVINFDTVSEPSSSHSVDLYGVYLDKALPEQFQQHISLVDSERANDQQNSLNHVRETNVDVLHHSTDYSTYPPNSNQNALVSQSREGNRTENPSLNLNSGNQSLEKVFNKCIPFITFLSFKAIYDHREGILIFAGLLVTFIHANSVVKREIAKQSRRSFISLGIIFTNLFVSICFIYYVFRDQKLYKKLSFSVLTMTAALKVVETSTSMYNLTTLCYNQLSNVFFFSLIFIPPYSQPISIWDLLWIVGITDFILKFITIQLKVGMTCFPAKLLPYSSRGKWYLMLERTSQLYRGLAPVQPWLYYLMETYQGPENMVGIFFSMAYVVSKGSDIISKAKLFLKAFLKLLHHASIGVRPNSEQLLSAGLHCPICHDEYNSPVILQCRHVFCEGCVSTWFDREQTCPLCRAKVADDPSWRDGATSLFTQLF